jgi:tricorn protease
MILSAALALVVLAQDAPVEMRLMRFPTVHGENVVFTYAGDLWVSKRSGGFARRLTSHPGNEVRARISPNGRWIAFTGQYDGNNEAYVIPIEGGEPRRLTYDPNTVNVIGWTPDNRVMAASVMGNFTHFQQRLWLLNPEGGLPIQTPVMEITEGSFSPDGTTLVYTRTPSYLYNWRRYRGGTQGRISFFNMRSFEYSELPANREQYYFPMWVGDSVFYISDKNLGTQNLYRYDVKTKGETQLTRFADADIRFPSTDGTTIVFERDGYLYTYDIATANIARLSPLVRSDFVQARPMLRSLGTQISSVAISPSGVRVAVEARGDIFSLPARSGETRNLTNTSGVRERFPSWSPNGAVIAYAGDETGFYEVYTRPQMGGDPTKLTDAKLQIDGLMWAPNSRHLLIRTRSKELYILDTENRDLKRIFQGRFGMGAFDVSPDSRWVAYINQMPNGFGAVHLYEIASGQHTRVSDGSYDDNNVAFDMNGRFLYTVSTRTFQPGFGLYEYSLKIQDAQRVYVLPLTKDQMHPLVAAGDEEAGGRPPAGQTQPPAQQQPDGQQQQVARSRFRWGRPATRSSRVRRTACSTGKAARSTGST